MLAARSVAHVRPIRLLLDESRSDFIGLAPLSICPVSRLRQLGDMTRVGTFSSMLRRCDKQLVLRWKQGWDACPARLV